ncbi:hypothetical protein [Actinomadura verrucosospora]|uniref:hypothetical protein n=1 Tax=Actinomadura verrucosospora TaxID=46165 RepID=UPI001C208B97|nr:hypothetical protein [Actinomadura verrucosospora]
MIDTIDADDAWCPPTFSPDGLGRTRLAWWIIALASQRTRSSTSPSTAYPPSAGIRPASGLLISRPRPGRPPAKDSSNDLLFCSSSDLQIEQSA